MLHDVQNYLAVIKVVGVGGGDEVRRATARARQRLGLAAPTHDHVGTGFEQPLDERSLPGPGRTRDDEDASSVRYRLRRSTSSLR